QVEIEVGEVLHRRHGRRDLRGAKTRMRRRDQPGFCGERIEHRRLRIDADAGMEKQERPAFAALEHLGAQALDDQRSAGARHRPTSRKWHLDPTRFLLYYVKRILYYRTGKCRPCQPTARPTRPEPPASCRATAIRRRSACSPCCRASPVPSATS